MSDNTTDEPKDTTPDEPTSVPQNEPAQAGGTTPEPTGEPAPAEGSAQDEVLVESNADLDTPKGISRRKLLTGAAIGAGVIAGGTWFLLRSTKNDNQTANGLTVTESWADRELALTAPSGVCEAPLIIAHEKGFFEEAGLNVVLRKTGDDEDVTAAVGSGTYVASNGIFFNYLGPIYNGTPVKLSGGLHYGCLDLYVRNDGSVPTLVDLRDRRIGVSSLQGSATNYFSLDLLDVGINSSPEAGEVEWVVIEQDLLPEALQSEQVDAIATAGGFLPIIQGVQDGWALQLSSNNAALGQSQNADQPCCAVALNNTFVEQDPVTAAALVNAWSEAARWVGQNIEETAEIESSKDYVPGTPEEIVDILRTLTFEPSPSNLREVLAPGIAKYKETGFLPADVDVEALADLVFVDLGLNY